MRGGQHNLHMLGKENEHTHNCKRFIDNILKGDKRKGEE